MENKTRQTTIDENGNYIIDEGGCYSEWIPDDVSLEYSKPLPEEEKGNVSPVQISFLTNTLGKKKKKIIPEQ